MKPFLFAIPLSLLAALTLNADDTHCYGILTGNHAKVIVPEGASCVVAEARIAGDIEVMPGGALTVNGPVFIGGNVQSDGGRFVRINGGGVSIQGNVQIKNAQDDSGVQPGTRIGGNFQYEENAGYLVARGAIIHGDFQATKNGGGGEVANLTVRQNMQCKENGPRLTGFGNRAREKQGQCAAL